VKRFTYSNRAKSDLISIAEYTLKEWGESQAAKYIDQLEDSCQWLAQNPSLSAGYAALDSQGCVA